VIGVQLQTAKQQQQAAEEERLQMEQSKGRQAVERSNSKSIRRRQSTEPPSSGLQEQLVALSSKHEHDVSPVHTSRAHVCHALLQRKALRFIVLFLMPRKLLIKCCTMTYIKSSWTEVPHFL